MKVVVMASLRELKAFSETGSMQVKFRKVASSMKFVQELTYHHYGKLVFQHDLVETLESTVITPKACTNCSA
jgi:hypothetical protein